MTQRGLILGKICEEKAVRFLRSNGYRILERNYRCRFGEIDVVAEEGGCMVFIEVKSCSSPLFGPPYFRVTKKKKEHIVRSVFSYLSVHDLQEAPCRVDIVSITLDSKDPVELIKDAFWV